MTAFFCVLQIARHLSCLQRCLTGIVFVAMPAILAIDQAAAEVVSIANAKVSITASGGPEPESTTASNDSVVLKQVDAGWGLNENGWHSSRTENITIGDGGTTIRLYQLGGYTTNDVVTHRWWGCGTFLSVMPAPSLVYTPFVNLVSPFPEVPADEGYIYKVGLLTAYGGGSEFYAVDTPENVSPVYSYNIQASFAIQSTEGLARVFMTAYGAPTPSGEAVVYDSGALGYATSAPVAWQEEHSSSLSGFSSQYAIYAVVPVPEPSTYAMALAGLACGGFSMWRRRKGQALAA